MVDLRGKRFGLGAPSLNLDSLDSIWSHAVIQSHVIHSHGGGILLDFVWIGPDRHVLIGAFVPRSASLLFKHLVEIRGRFPPGRLDAIPGESKHREHRDTN